MCVCVCVCVCVPSLPDLYIHTHTHTHTHNTELGEETLLAAAREAREETGLTKDDLRFYPHAVCVTDAIYKSSGGGDREAVQFHYVITHQVHTHTHTHTHTQTHTYHLYIHTRTIYTRVCVYVCVCVCFFFPSGLTKDDTDF